MPKQCSAPTTRIPFVGLRVCTKQLRHLSLPGVLVAVLAISGCGSSTSRPAVTLAAPVSSSHAAEVLKGEERAIAASARKERHEASVLAAARKAKHKKDAAAAKRRAKRRAQNRAWGERQVRLLHQEEREGTVEKALTPSQVAEGERRGVEGEQKFNEMQRRADGELTPEEKENREKDSQEIANEVEAIKEDARIREREEGKVP